MSPPRAKSLRQLVKRPLANAAELTELERLYLRSSGRWYRFGGCLGFVALLLFLINLLTSAFEPVPLAERTWSLNVIFAIVAFWTPFFVRALWGRQRLLQAQRRLLRQRGLADDGTSDIGEVAEAVELLVERIERILSSRPDLAEVLRGAAGRAQELCRQLAEESVDETASLDERAALTAFRFELASFEIDAFTRQGYLQSDDATAALGHAAALLRP
jgi:hypothetical protein